MTECAGGDTTLAELLSVPITPQRLPTACAVVVVDLSKPHGVLAVAAEWLKAIHARAQDCLDKLKSRDPTSHAKIQQATLARTTAFMPPGAAASGGQHPDVYVDEISQMQSVTYAHRDFCSQA